LSNKNNNSGLHEDPMVTALHGVGHILLNFGGPSKFGFINEKQKVTK